MRIINSRDNWRGESHHPGPHEDEAAIKSSDEEMYNNKVGRRHMEEAWEWGGGWK